MKPRSRHLVILSLRYWILRRLLELAVLALRPGEAKEIEIMVLRHQLHVLSRQVKRPGLKPHDRALLDHPANYSAGTTSEAGRG